MGQQRFAGPCQLLQQRRLLVVLAVYFFGRDDYGCGYFVFGIQVEQTHTLRGAARGAHRLGVEANDLAPLADNHQFAGFIDQENGRALASGFFY